MALWKTWVGKFWPDLEISEAFVMGLEVSFSGDFASWSLEVGNPGLAVSNLPFYTPNSGVRVRERKKIRRMRGRLERGLFLRSRPMPKPLAVFSACLRLFAPRSHNLNALKKSRGDFFLSIFSLLPQTESLFTGYLENANGLWIEFEWSIIFH